MIFRFHFAKLEALDVWLSIIDDWDVGWRRWWSAGTSEGSRSPRLSEDRWRWSLWSVGRRGGERRGGEAGEARVSAPPGTWPGSAGGSPGRSPSPSRTDTSPAWCSSSPPGWRCPWSLPSSADCQWFVFCPSPGPEALLVEKWQFSCFPARWTTRSWSRGSPPPSPPSRLRPRSGREWRRRPGGWSAPLGTSGWTCNHQEC